jgi:hypothetical protein
MKNPETPKQSAWSMVLSCLKDQHNIISYTSMTRLDNELPYINGTLPPSEMRDIVEQHRKLFNRIFLMAERFGDDWGGVAPIEHPDKALNDAINAFISNPAGKVGEDT